MLDKTAVVLHKCHEAGIPLISGTDTGFAIIPYGEWHAREMELMMTYGGLNSLEAIASMTSMAARTVNLDGRLGVIAEGMLADLLVVNGDPEKNIRVLQDKSRIEVVIKDGAVVDFGSIEDEPRWTQAGKLMAYSTTDLMWSQIYGNPADRLKWDHPRADLADDLYRELDPIGRARRTSADKRQEEMD